jgi:hypothetical protein
MPLCIRQSVVAPSVVVPSVVELNVVVLNAVVPSVVVLNVIVLNAVVQSVVVPFAISLQRNGISAAFAYGECICHSLQRNGKACGECTAFARVSLYRVSLC